MQLRSSWGSLLFTLKWRLRPRQEFTGSAATNNGSPNQNGAGTWAWDMMREPILQMGADKMTPRYAVHKPFTVRPPDRSEWERGSEQRGITKTNEGTWAGVYGHGMKQRFSFSLGQYTTVFQAEVYDVKACADENIKRGYCKRTFIFSLTVKQRSKHLTIVGLTQSWSGTATNP
jgi:hypothetical protein